MCGRETRETEETETKTSRHLRKQNARFARHGVRLGRDGSEEIFRITSPSLIS